MNFIHALSSQVNPLTPKFVQHNVRTPVQGYLQIESKTIEREFADAKEKNAMRYT